MPSVNNQILEHYREVRCPKIVIVENIAERHALNQENKRRIKAGQPPMTPEDIKEFLKPKVKSGPVVPPLNYRGDNWYAVAWGSKKKYSDLPPILPRDALIEINDTACWTTEEIIQNILKKLMAAINEDFNTDSAEAIDVDYEYVGPIYWTLDGIGAHRIVTFHWPLKFKPFHKEQKLIVCFRLQKPGEPYEEELATLRDKVQKEIDLLWV